MSISSSSFFAVVHILRIAYHIRFQVDFTEHILDELRDGSYCSVNNSFWGLCAVTSNGWASWHESWFSPADPSSGHDEYRFHGMDTRADAGYCSIIQGINKPCRCVTLTDSVLILTGTNTSGPTSACSASADQGSLDDTPHDAHKRPHLYESDGG